MECTYGVATFRPSKSIVLDNVTDQTVKTQLPLVKREEQVLENFMERKSSNNLPSAAALYQ